jgi:hypothetical protein
MADDIESAEEHLSKGSSPFHQVRLRHSTVKYNIRTADLFGIARSRSMCLHEGDIRI